MVQTCSRACPKKDSEGKESANNGKVQRICNNQRVKWDRSRRRRVHSVGSDVGVRATRSRCRPARIIRKKYSWTVERTSHSQFCCYACCVGVLRAGEEWSSKTVLIGAAGRHEISFQGVARGQNQSLLGSQNVSCASTKAAGATKATRNIDEQLQKQTNMRSPNLSMHEEGAEGRVR